MAIGYNSKVVKDPPTSFKDLLKPDYKNQVALNGNPTQAGAAFAAVYAAALANGGSFNNIAPGITYFQKLSAEGNFVPVTGAESTVESGQTPDPDLVGLPRGVRGGAAVPGLEGGHPERRPLRRLLQPGHQRHGSRPGRRPPVGGVPVLDHRPEPVAARVGSSDRAGHPGQERYGGQDGLAALPAAPGGAITFPSVAQTTAAENLVSQDWASAIGG